MLYEIFKAFLLDISLISGLGTIFLIGGVSAFFICGAKLDKRDAEEAKIEEQIFMWTHLIHEPVKYCVDISPEK